MTIWGTVWGMVCPPGRAQGHPGLAIFENEQGNVPG